MYFNILYIYNSLSITQIINESDASLKSVWYRFRVAEGYSNAIFRENGIPVSAANHNDSANKIFTMIGISLENGVYYIYAFYKDFYTGELKFNESDFDCIVWYIPN